MNARLASLRCGVLAVALALLFVGPGCGGGGGGYYSPEGTLEVANDDFSSDVLDAFEVDEVGGPDFFHFNVGLFPGEAFDVGLFPATYDVTLYWNDGFVDFAVVDVYDGLVTILTVSN